jgi:hypothetical protein
MIMTIRMTTSMTRSLSLGVGEWCTVAATIRSGRWGSPVAGTGKTPYGPGADPPGAGRACRCAVRGCDRHGGGLSRSIADVYCATLIVRIEGGI